MTEVKLLPQNLELEKQVLGAILIETTAINEAIEILSDTDFYHPAHGEAFAACVSLASRFEPVDLTTVTEEIRKRGGDYSKAAILLSECTNKVGTAAHLQSWCLLLKEYSIRRTIIRMAEFATKEAFGDENDPLEVLGAASMQLEAITGQITGFGGKAFRDSVWDVYNQLKEQAESKSTTTGLKTFIPEIDRLTSGLQDTDLIIVAGRPGMGKTAFALQIAHNQAEAGNPIGFFSLEMGRGQLVKRLMAQRTRKNVKEYRMADARVWQEIHQHTERLAEMPLWINDKGGISIQELCAIAKGWKLRHKIKALYIDYLQLITVRGERFGNDNSRVTYISAQLKSLAKNLNIPVVALSQLSRECEKRTDKRPMPSDLRDSGAIEQDADLIIFPYRDSAYNEESPKDKAEIIFGKARDGRVGKVDINCDMETFWFGENQYAPLEPARNEFKAMRSRTVAHYSEPKEKDDLPF